MEDSGIESEDKSSHPIEEDRSEQMTFMENANHMPDLEVIFSGKNSMQKTDNDCDNVDLSRQVVERPPPNTCRILQRKLELKVERAKRNYCQYQESKNNQRQTQSATLVPINRLPIPGDVDHRPLVDYHTESDDMEEVSFFPKEPDNKQRCKKYAELTDTFSIQEMTIETDSGSEDDSENLELLTPRLKKSFIQYLGNCFCFHTASTATTSS